MTNSHRNPAEERKQVDDEMSSRLASRFDDTDEEEPGDAHEQGDVENKSKSSKLSMISGRERKSVKDRPSVFMHLPEDLHSDLNIRLDELNARYNREYGEGLERNRNYYPAIIKAGLEGKDIKEISGL